MNFEDSQQENEFKLNSSREPLTIKSWIAFTFWDLHRDLIYTSKQFYNSKQLIWLEKARYMVSVIGK